MEVWRGCCAACHRYAVVRPYKVLGVDFECALCADCRHRATEVYGRAQSGSGCVFGFISSVGFGLGVGLLLYLWGH